MPSSVSESVSVTVDSATCAPVKTARPLDYAVTPGAARTFLQRIGVLQTVIPGARAQFDNLRVHDIPLRSPLPIPALLQPLETDNDPDHGKTLDWPHPDLEQEASD